MINFNVPLHIETGFDYIRKAVENQKLCGDGAFTKLCTEWIEKNIKANKVLLTTSCTHALEMAAILCDIKPSDEVIMASYNFPSAANAFVLHGAKIVFIDIKPDTMNLNENLIEAAVTDKTKAIVATHYAGVSCNMDVIIKIAEKYSLRVIEDAAQGIMSQYNNKYLGTIGDFGCFSFHETKNFNMGEGGALLINDNKYFERAEIIRKKGTNGNKFWRGEIDKYTWIDKGSSYLPGELNAAYLFSQFEKAHTINKSRLSAWNRYYENLKSLENEEFIKLPFVPNGCMHNAHMFYIKTINIKDRTLLIDYLKSKGIMAVFHYIPLHSSVAGLKFGILSGEDRFTTTESERILRLPLYYEISESDIDYVCECVKEFFKDKQLI